ncbi:hypothetical protein MCAP1_003284 [Malassezia caprae]|uniref:Uncharacterized protein n=1 Tax=Malassezia caprae TaxID=1381934 RepID=A0AAF0E9Y6_9BASI|nr:hypothetical protein MCAP1_003284 [Malassezia caprae]
MATAAATPSRTSAAPAVRWPASTPAPKAPAPARPMAPPATVPPRPRMSLASAQRRIVWNVGGLAALWGIGMLWPSSVDIYYRLTDWLMLVDGVPAGADEVLDSVLLWLRMALTIVFLLNAGEAALRVALPPAPATAPPSGTPVGEALARRASGRAAPYQASAVSPVPGASAIKSRSPSLRASPTHLRTSPFRSTHATPAPAASSASPDGAASALGLGRPSSTPTPFPARLSTPSALRRSSPSRDGPAWSPRVSSTRSPQARSVSPASFRSDWDDAWEVEQALRALSTPRP